MSEGKSAVGNWRDALARKIDNPDLIGAHKLFGVPFVRKLLAICEKGAFVRDK
jgi:hypothetical protein